MSVGTEVQVILPRFQDAAKIAIAQLSPDRDNIDQLHIEASVALIWPYSSSTQRLSLLLAERDIRLRKTKGQVRVTFHGDCAREVAKTQVGIGDLVKLGLDKATWTKTGEDVSTPGKKVDWDVDFSKRVELELQRGEDITASLDITADSPSPVQIKSSIVEIDGPKVNGYIDIRKAGLTGSYLSPARHKHDRHSSGSFVNATLDPFADDDFFISGRSRKRTKFARHSGAWQLMDTEKETPVESERDSVSPSSPLQGFSDEQSGADRVPSMPDPLQLGTVGIEPLVVNPPQPDIPISTAEVEEEEVRGENGQSNDTPPHAEDAHLPEEVITPVMGPPQTVSSASPELHLQSYNPGIHDPAMTPTPVLRPLPSSGLALISPLVEHRSWTMGYFPALSGSQSELDAISHPATESALPTDQNSLLGHPGTANITHQEHPGTEDFPTSKDVQQEMLLEGHNVNDLLGSGVALQNKFDETVTDLLEDSVLIEQSSTFNHAPVSPLADRTFDVDLDALQQQIDESSRLWQESLPPPEVEDGDMYGPPSVNKETTIPTDQVLNLSDTARLVEEELVPSARTPLQIESSPVQAAAEEHTSFDQYELVQQRIVPQSPVLIESSEEEDDYSEDEADYSEEEAESSDVGEEEEEKEEVAHNLEESIISEERILEELHSPGTPVIERENTVHPNFEYKPPAPASVPLTEEVTSMAPISVTEEVMSTLPEPLPHNELVVRTDGTDEAYEDEHERSLVRRTVGLSTPAYQTVLTSPEDSPLEAQSVVSNNSEGTSELGKGTTDGVEEEQRSDNLKDVTTDLRDASEFANDGQAQADLIENATAAIETATTTLARSSQLLSRIDKPLQLVTPDATQQHAILDDLGLLQPSELLSAFPPTPILTQDTLDPELPGLLTAEISSGKRFDGEDETVPPQTLDEQSKPLPRASQRLSRKSFTSEKMSNQYFTPRRSSRNIQSSPTFLNEPFSSAVQPSSPTLSKQLPRSSPPVDDQTREGSANQAQTTFRGRTTLMSYYPYLSCLHEFYNLQVDCIAVCTVDSKSPQRAKTGPKDYHTTSCLADPSLTDGAPSIRAQLFRPRKDALPIANRGDIILLRNMKVQTHEHNVMLLSTDSSSWAVLKPTSKQMFDIAINGPPIEYEDGEREEAKRLLQWWRDAGEKTYPDIPNFGMNDEYAGARRSVSPIFTRSQARRAHVSDDPGSHHDGGGNPEPSSPLAPTPSSPIVQTKRQRHRRSTSNRSDVVIHELRDGATYVDGKGRQRSESVIHELRDGYTYVDD